MRGLAQPRSSTAVRSWLRRMQAFERSVLVSVMLWRSVTTMPTDGWPLRRSLWASRSFPTTVFSTAFQVSCWSTRNPRHARQVKDAEGERGHGAKRRPAVFFLNVPERNQSHNAVDRPVQGRPGCHKAHPNTGEVGHATTHGH